MARATITLTDKTDESKKTVYTFEVTRPRDTTKTIANSGIVFVPDGREIWKDKYDEKTEGIMYVADEDGSFAQYQGVNANRLYYRTYATSGMKRTNETLHILFGVVPYEADPRFREVDFGIFEMHSYEELKDTPDYQIWLTGDNEANVPPNGESGIQMKTRVFDALSELREDTCIITHGGVIAAIMEHLFPNENKNRYEWQPKNSCGYVISGDRYNMIP